ncbi:MAG: allantoicase [Candidatus Acidiferrales bacterium]
MNDFTKLVDLASERLGGCVLEANDDFFASRHNLLKYSSPVYIDGKYTVRGKWMDGWETRRRRTPGYDWCVIRLGLRGILRGVVVDTSFFTGNFPEYVSLEACDLGGPLPLKAERARLKASSTRWFEILPHTALQGDAQNRLAIDHSGIFTHLRLKIYPDGGVARLRVHGEAIPAARRASRKEIDLAAVENGGSIAASSDQFYGAPLNLLMPGRAKNMADGWETRRRRGPGHDWVIVRLGAAGNIGKIEVDTAHFKGNFPESCLLEALHASGSPSPDSLASSSAWKQILPRSQLKANARHIFQRELRESGAATHIRFNIFPDGGVSRLRIYGNPRDAGKTRTVLDRFNELAARQAARALLDCCGSKRWVSRMLEIRPFATVEELLEAADKIWKAMDRKEQRAAFGHHPPIAGKKAGRKQSAKARRWSRGEQSRALQGETETLAVLAAANQAYHAAFGHVYLVCATGKSSEEILKTLRQRLSNDPETEWRIAAEEQRKITRLRLEKLLES